MSSSSTPRAEVHVDADLVRDLLSRQHPDLAQLPIRFVESGWDNFMVRLGDELAVRLPRRAIADPLILNEQKWLPHLAAQLPLPIPVPVRVGIPQQNYPFHWSVLKWEPGLAADLAPPNADQSTIVADFLSTLHRIPLPVDAPANPLRGCPLHGKQTDTEVRMAKLAMCSELITAELRAAWQAALVEPPALTSCWIAGDVHARNVLTQHGKVTAFIDWGDVCAGDPATDLACIWALFGDRSARQTAITKYGMNCSLVVRSMGWAIFFGVALMETGRHDTPRHYEMGRSTLERLNVDLQLP